jgi:hypothetical protein
MISQLISCLAILANLIKSVSLYVVRSTLRRTNYGYSLDYLIIDILYEGTKSYRQLKRYLEIYLKTGKQISFDTYHRHIRLLLKDKLLVKERIRYKVFLSLEETYRGKLANGQPIDSNYHFPEEKGILISSL